MNNLVVQVEQSSHCQSGVYTGCGNKKDPTTKTVISLKRHKSFKGKFPRLLRTIFDTKDINFIKFHYYMQKWYEL